MASRRYDREQRQGETTRLLLAQIYQNAEQLRAAKRGQPDAVDSDPLSLIELIQASGTVFERFGIAPPEDAVYHRHLLSLSIDPDKDWRRKVANFQLRDRSRVRRLSSESARPIEAASTSFDSLDTPPRRKSKKEELQRQMQRLSLLNRKTKLLEREEVSQVGQFGDRLALPRSSRHRSISRDWSSDETIRPASPVSRRGGVLAASPSEVHPINFNQNSSSSIRQFSSPVGDSQRSELEHVSTSLDGSDQWRSELFKSTISDARLLSTTFERWKAVRDLHELAQKRKDHDVQMRRSLMPMAAIFAIFQWIEQTLPEKYQIVKLPRDLHVPAAIARRINVTSTSVSDLSLLNKFARRLQIARIKSILVAWHFHTSNVTSLRSRSLARRRAITLEKAFTCMLQWRLFTETRKCLVERASWVSLRRCRRTLRIALGCWQQALKRRQKEQSAFNEHLLNLKIKSWKKWLRVLKGAQEMRVIQFTFLRRRGIGRWYRYARLKLLRRDQMLAADALFRTYILKYCIQTLRRHVDYSRELQRKMSNFCNDQNRKSKRQVMINWQHYVLRSAELRELAKKFVQWRRRRILRNHLQNWITWINYHLATNEKLYTAAQKRRQRALVRVISQWQAHFRESQTHDVAQARRIQVNLMKSVWQKWRRLAGVRLVVMTFLRSYRLYVLCNYVKMWRDYTTKLRVWRDALSTLQEAHRNRVMTECWRALHANRILRQDQRQIACKLCLIRQTTQACVLFRRWVTYTLSERSYHSKQTSVEQDIRYTHLVKRTWAIWRKLFRLAHLGKLAANNLSSYRKSRVLRIWKRFVVLRRQSKASCMKAVQAMTTSRLGSVFLRWRVYAVKRRQIVENAHALKQLNTASYLERYWCIWRIAHGRKKGQQLRVLDVINKWKTQTVRKCFCRWKVKCSIQKRHRLLLQRCQTVSLTRSLAIFFQAWKSMWRLRTNLIRAENVAVHQIQTWKLQRTIAQWHRNAQHRTDEGSRLQRALLHWQHLGLVAPFQRWVEFVRSRKILKTQWAVVSQFSLQCMTRAHFMRWKIWLKHIQHTRMRLESSANHMQRIRMKRCIQLLYKRAQSRRRIRQVFAKLASSSARCTLTRHFSAWLRYMINKQALKALHSTQNDAMLVWKIRRCIQQWEQHARMRKLLRSSLLQIAMSSKATNLKHSFKAWRDYNKQRAFRRALTQRALVFQVFCILPAFFSSWRKFVEKQKRQRALGLRASQLWNHQLEHRAFYAWTEFIQYKKQSRRAIARWQNGTAMRCFSAWVSALKYEKILTTKSELAVIVFKQRYAKATLLSWYRAARIRRTLRLLAGRSLERTTLNIFTRWKEFAHRQHTSRLLVNRIQNQTMVRIFNSWKDRIVFEKTTKCSIRERFAGLWLNDLRRECWGRWRRFCSTRRLIKMMWLERKRQTAYFAFVLWKNYSRRQKWRSECTRVVSNITAIRTMSEFWNEWRIQLQLRVCVKLMRGQMIQRRQRDSLQWRFKRWRYYSQNLHNVQLLKRRIELRLMRTVLHAGFAVFMAIKADERTLMLQIQAVHRECQRQWLADQAEARIERIEKSEKIMQTRVYYRLIRMTYQAWVRYQSSKLAMRSSIHLMRRRLTAGTAGINIKCASHLVVRWMKLHLARATLQWRSQAYRSRRNRQNAIAAIEYWHTSTTRHVFEAWRAVQFAEKRHRLIGELYVKNASKRSFQRWRLGVRRCITGKELGARAKALHVVSVSRGVISAWRLFSAKKISRKELITSAYRKSCVRILREVLSEWNAYTLNSRTKRVQLTMANVFYHTNLLRKCASEWKNRAQIIRATRHQLLLSTERLQVLLVCSSFRAWRAWSQQHRKFSLIVSALSLKAEVQTVSRVFSGWRAYVEVKIRHRCTANSFYNFRRYHLTVDALKDLVSRAKYRKIATEKAQLFKNVLEGSQLSSLFTRWRKYAALSRKARAVTLQYLQGKLLPTFWKAWIAFVQHKRTLNTTAMVIAKTWSNISLKRAWNALAWYRLNRIENRARIKLAEQHAREYRLRVAVRFWQISTEWERHFASVCRAVITRWQLAIASRCFFSWRVYTASQHALLTTLQIVSQKNSQQQIMTAWCAWRKVFLVHRAGRRSHLIHYWRRWALLSRQKRSLGHLKDRIRVVVLKCLKRRAFQALQEYVSRRKIGKAMAQMSSRFSDSILSRRTFASWRAYFDQQREKKSRMRVIIRFMQSRLLHTAFRSIVAFHGLNQRRRFDFSRAEAFYTACLQKRLFARWNTAAQSRRNQRERLCHYVKMLQFSVQSKSFRSWAGYTAHRRDLRKRMATALALRTQLCRHTVFVAWRKMVAKGKKTQKAISFHNSCCTRHALHHWRQFVVLSKVERMIGASDKRTIESRFITWRKIVATTRSVRMFQFVTQKKRNITVLATSFLEWKQWSAVHARCKRILSRLSSGNRLRFRFHLWKVFATHRRRLSMLLLPIPVHASNCSSSSLNGNQNSGSKQPNIESIRVQLAVKARALQQFEYEWDLPNVWRYWRLAFHAVLFHRLRALQRHFLAWQHHAQHQVRARRVIGALIGTKRQATLSNIFLGWRDVVRHVKQLQRERQRERQLWTIANTEMLRREKRTLRGLFAVWRSVVSDVQNLQSSADSYYRARFVTKLWLAWRYDYLEIASKARKEYNQRQTELRRHALGRAVKILKGNCDRRKRARLAIEYCSNKRNDRLIPDILTEWRKWAMNRQLSEKHREFVEKERLRRVMRNWNDTIKTKLRHRAIIAMIQGHKSEELVYMMWTKWEMYKNHRRRCYRLEKRAIAFRVHHLLHSRWHMGTLGARNARRHCSMVAQQLLAFRKRRAIQKWGVFAATRAHSRRCDRYIQRKFLRNWHANVKMVLAIRFSEWTERLFAKKVLARWHIVARKLALWRKLTSKMLGIRLKNTRRVVWRRWLIFIEGARRKRTATEFNSHRLKLNSVYSWQNAVEMLREEWDVKIEDAKRHVADGLRRRVLAQWRALTYRNKQRRFVTLACVFKLDGFRQAHLLRVVIQDWQRFVLLQTKSRSLDPKREHRICKQVVSGWCQWVLSKKVLRKAELEANRYYLQRLVSASFFYWQNYALAWREVDAAAAIPSRTWRRRLSIESEFKLSDMEGDVSADEGKSDSDGMGSRRPMSPVMKRMKKKKMERQRRLENTLNQTASQGSNHETEVEASELPTLAEAAELSVSVRHRLRVLGHQ